MRFSTKTFWMKAVVAVGVVVSLGYSFQSRFHIGVDTQETLSMGKRIFVIDLKDHQLQKGDVYVFRTVGAEPVYKDGTELVKRMVAMPGDTVEITDTFDILVNGESVAKGLWHLREAEQNLVLERFTGKRILKENQFWMCGESFKSFDSRYFGTISAEQIKGKAYAIF